MTLNLNRLIDSFRPEEVENYLAKEWLVTNGIGGYASGAVSGITTRKYHGLLVAALPPPLGRTIMLNHVSEKVILPNGNHFWLNCEEKQGEIRLDGANNLKKFYLDQGLPVWVFEKEGVVIEKRLLLIHMQNTLHLSYRLISSPTAVRLSLRPAMHFRGHEEAVNKALTTSYTLILSGDHYEVVTSNYPSLKLAIQGPKARFVWENQFLKEFFYRIEAKRGYESVGDLWCPGYFKVDLTEQGATLLASTEAWETIQALSPRAALQAENERRRQLLANAPPNTLEGIGSELILAADQFIITPTTRLEDAARARASGDEIRTIIAGYHWFTDWGRDTMISLEGLTLSTGRRHEAGWILRTFNHYVKDGLIPNMFPEGQNAGLYHTADASLWFFHALYRYLTLTEDRGTLRLILPNLLDIISHHLKGTRFGIQVDANDGLLAQGAEGYQLTWMDAKVGQWVVTPRRGKPVEINALWYNALRLTETWLKEEERYTEAHQIKEWADLAFQSFNQRFWYAKENYLYDVVDGEDGNDTSCRPNQIFAISLDNPVLNPDKWSSVVHIVQDKLLTPYGLRTLAPNHPEYKARYDGDLRSRDAAYHQGTVWAWLIGPFIDAWLKVHPDKPQEARIFLEGFAQHLSDAGVGSISEIFDAAEPYTPRGCIAQAWSVAEVLRSWVKTGRS